MREYARPSGFVFLPMLRMCTVCVSFRFDGLFIIENTRILYFLISQILFSAEFTTEKKHSNSVFFFWAENFENMLTCAVQGLHKFLFVKPKLTTSHSQTDTHTRQTKSDS